MAILFILWMLMGILAGCGFLHVPHEFINDAFRGVVPKLESVGKERLVVLAAQHVLARRHARDLLEGGPEMAEGAPSGLMGNGRDGEIARLEHVAGAEKAGDDQILLRRHMEVAAEHAPQVGPVNAKGLRDRREAEVRPADVLVNVLGHLSEGVPLGEGIMLRKRLLVKVDDGEDKRPDMRGQDIPMGGHIMRRRVGKLLKQRQMKPQDVQGLKGHGPLLASVHVRSKKEVRPQ